MADTLVVLLLSLLLFLCTLCVGLLPLTLTVEQDTILWLNLAASGLLVGTCLCVVVPEGIAALEATGSADSLGLTLLSGFAFMLFADWISDGEQHPDSSSYEAVGERSQSNNPLLIGLTLHALADGLAFSAARVSTTTSHKAGLLILFAVFAHKIPVTLSVGSLLKNSNQSRQKAKKDLLIYAAACPTAILLSYFVLSTFAVGSSATLPASCLLFSGGSLLYVSSVHIIGALPPRVLSKYQLAALIAAMFFPLFLVKVELS